MLKFPIDEGIVTIRSIILIPAECATVITSSEEVAIEGTLSAKGRTELCSLLKENLDIFSWQPSDMTGVPRLVAEHRLNIRKGYLPVWQKKRARPGTRQGHTSRGMVKKHDDSWRLCVDFTDSNKACPQDCYTLLEIDWKVESLCGYHFKCFLDAYKGYQQIQLVESDEEKTAFHTGQGVYCYTKMPFSLKNASATYQRLVDKAFDSQIGQNIEVYIDDLVVKSHTEAEMLRYIGETFCTLRKINMKLNPKKSPKPKEELIVYLSASYEAISAVLMTERGTVQKPVYFVSRVLQGLELNYTPMEKIFLSLVFTAKRLRRPRTSVKGQFLADFLTEMPDESQPDVLVVETQQEPWTLFTDRSSCVDGFGAGLILTSLEGTEQSFFMPWLRYVRPLQAEFVIIEIHEGSCSMHARPRLGQIFDSRYGLFYEMDRSGSRGDNHRQKSKLDLGGRNQGLPRQGKQELAVIPVEIGMPTYRTTAVDVVHNDKELRLNLDLLEEQRERAAIHEAKSKLKMIKYYNGRVRGVTFRPGDFVYRSNDASHAVDRGKLGPKWEGPYEVTEALGDGAYKIRSMDGTVLLRTWNIANLKKCYL
nr:reverse transcriptase domain-containing protein [Tanacetum cinerariifolium]